MLVAIVGATGTGKSALAVDLGIELARSGTAVEVVNADAMQLYRGMDIGTAKLPMPDRRGIPHHLLDVLDVTEDAAVAEYQVRAREAIAGIQARGAVPVLVGGSGLYVSSVLWSFRFPARDPQVRRRLEYELERDGVAATHRKLSEVDPSAAEAIGPHNARRIVRALEVVELTGKPFVPGLPDDEPWTATSIVGLRRERAELVLDLDQRVERMWQDGLLDEVRALLAAGLDRSTTAGRAIGYAQAIAQLAGESTRSEAIASTQALTRRYARRQVSWFRRYRDATWFDATQPQLTARILASLDLSG